VFAVFGATGRLGSATVRALLDRGAHVRAVLHDASHAGRMRALGAEAVVADLRDDSAIARALREVTAAQVICPMLTQAPDAGAEMRRIIDAIASGLRANPPEAVVAISDFGAQLESGTGITLTFHQLEASLRGVAGSVTFLRSAEHMQNWSRFVTTAVETGVLPSLHQPLTKLFPTISAPDVGVAAADLLATTSQSGSPRIVHVEGPRRYTALDVAATLSDLVGREIVAHALARSEWVPVLNSAGLGSSYAELVAAMFDAHNAGRIDADVQAGETRHGPSELRVVLASLLRGSRPGR
jgi:NAD(P)H dehydrogenase (quinone)